MEVANERTLRDLEYEKVKAAVAEFASSELGRRHIAALPPTAQLEIIEAELRRVEELKSVLLETDLAMGKLHDLYPILQQAQQTTALAGEDLLKILETLESGRHLKERIYQLEGYTKLQELAKGIFIFRELEELIRKTIDEKGQIKDNASPKLGELTRKEKELEERIRKALRAILQSSEYASIIQDTVITRRSGRFVIPIKTIKKHELDCVVQDSSDSGQTLYVEPASIVEDNNAIRELEGEIRDEKHRILKELTAKVKAESRHIESTLNVLSWLDSLYARAQYSIRMNCSTPQINTMGQVKLLRARHPLLPQDKVVPIDLSFGKDCQGVLITGPNTGGKTVSLKTIGLLTLMIQSGIPIPASPDSNMAIFTKVRSDIGEEQSIQQSLSTFSSHMRNIVHILREADENSLVLLDELGAGTDPQEGAALGIGVLRFLLESGAKMVVTTHFGALKRFAYKHPRLKTCSVDFDVVTLSPTYRIVEGVGASNAFIIAQRLGLSPEIIEKAKSFLSEGEVKAEDIIRELQRERKIIAEEREKLIAQLREAQQQRQEYDKMRAEIEKDREKALNEELKQLENLLKSARLTIERSLHAARQKTQEEALRGELKKILALEAELEVPKAHFKELETKRSEIIPLAPEELSVGKKVLIGHIEKVGTIREIMNQEQVVVEIEGLRVIAKPSDLHRPARIKKDIKGKGPSYIRPGLKASYSLSAGSSPKLELNVRGMTVSEAIREVDRYLDQVMLSDLKRAFIVHGKGTGTLRREIRKHLAELPQVKKYYSAPPSEGGDGVTIVELE